MGSIIKLWANFPSSDAPKHTVFCPNGHNTLKISPNSSIRVIQTFDPGVDERIIMAVPLTAVRPGGSGA